MIEELRRFARHMVPFLIIGIVFLSLSVLLSMPGGWVIVKLVFYIMLTFFIIFQFCNIVKPGFYKRLNESFDATLNQDITTPNVDFEKMANIIFLIVVISPPMLIIIMILSLLN